MTLFIVDAGKVKNKNKQLRQRDREKTYIIKCVLNCLKTIRRLQTAAEILMMAHKINTFL